MTNYLFEKSSYQTPEKTRDFTTGYQEIGHVFQQEAPQAAVAPVTPPSMEQDYYFQLLQDYGIRLNPAQKEAVRIVDGPLRIVAGAGSGKTTVLTSRIGYMVQSGQVKPSSILLVTFTKKASVEMIERLSRIPGIHRGAVREVQAGTYHSICLKILRTEGYQFKVLSSDRRRQIMIKNILKRKQLQDSYLPESILAIITGWKNAMVRPQDVEPETDTIAEVKDIYQEYERLKEEQNYYDFDDFLLEVYWLFKFSPNILKKYQSIFQYILCDEFQDTSEVQYKIIRMLAEPHNNLCIVGDDAQNIYGYRGSNSSYMMDFDKIYPDTKTVMLDINYRSGPYIVGFANELIKQNVKQIPKTLKVSNGSPTHVSFSRPMTSDEEAAMIVADIKDKQRAGVPLRELAVLYRTHATGRAIFDQLVLAEIPFVTYSSKGESFYESTFIKPIISLLRSITAPFDQEEMVEAAPIFYIAKKDMEQTLMTLNTESVPSETIFYKAIERIAEGKADFQRNQLHMKINACKKLLNMTAPQAIHEIRQGSIQYDRQLELDEKKTITIHKEMLLEMLEECEQASRGHQNIKGFVSFIDRVIEKNREMEELRNQTDLQAVQLMTIHTSKGLEHDSVYAIGFVEGILPHQSAISETKKEDSQMEVDEALEEERRLAYVCATRAKSNLYLSAPQYHRNKPAEASRFLTDGLGCTSPSS